MGRKLKKETFFFLTFLLCNVRALETKAGFWWFFFYCAGSHTCLGPVARGYRRLLILRILTHLSSARKGRAEIICGISCPSLTFWQSPLPYEIKARVQLACWKKLEIGVRKNSAKTETNIVSTKFSTLCLFQSLFHSCLPWSQVSSSMPFPTSLFHKDSFMKKLLICYWSILYSPAAKTTKMACGILSIGLLQKESFVWMFLSYK